MGCPPPLSRHKLLVNVHVKLYTCICSHNVTTINVVEIVTYTCMHVYLHVGGKGNRASFSLGEIIFWVCSTFDWLADV